jgi:hypothetical protein
MKVMQKDFVLIVIGDWPGNKKSWFAKDAKKKDQIMQKDSAQAATKMFFIPNGIRHGIT